MTRRQSRAGALRSRGVEASVVDAFDADGVRRAMAAARPEVVLDLLTDIPPRVNPRRFAEDMAGNDRIRREATPHLVGAAVAAGARRFVAESIAFVYAPGAGLAREDDPLWLPEGPGGFSRTVEAVAAMEAAVLGAADIEGVVLRCGWLYGPGTPYAASGGAMAQAVGKRQFPRVGEARGVYSFVYVDDAADAIVATLDRGGPGVYNVVDDEPAPAAEWLPSYAAELRTLPPRRAPVWLARLVAGRMAVAYTNELRGASNAKAKAELGWAPAHPTWRRRLGSG
jgi:nucleoside-diphosphate-sugar epimerase